MVEGFVPWRVHDVVLALVPGIGVAALSPAAARGLYPRQGGPDYPPAALTTLAAVALYLALLAAVWTLIVRRYGADWATVGLRRPRLDALLPTLLLAVLLVLGSAFILLGLSALLNAAGLVPNVRMVSDVSGQTGPLLVLGLAVSLLLAPLVEEVVFRGALCQSLRKRMGAAWATTGSALAFAALHAQPALWPRFILLGVILALAFERTRSLYPAICPHAVYNGAVIVLAWRTV